MDSSKHTLEARVNGKTFEIEWYEENEIENPCMAALNRLNRREAAHALGEMIVREAGVEL